MSETKKTETPTFLDQIIAESDAAHATSESQQLFIFPNRRAGLHFKQRLAGRLQKATWAPEVMSLSDFFRKISPLITADHLPLLFELYEVYRSFNPEKDEGFEAFLPWGQMILRDFDECDRFLVDTQLLFTQVAELHRIEEDFGPQLSDYESFRRFWQTFANEPLSEMKKQFALIWRQLYPIYLQYKERLNKKKMAYEGMIYRVLAEDLYWVDELEYSEIFLCGFNALSRSEMKIFKKLLASGVARIFWDSDKWYLENPNAEAGDYLRENFRQLPQPSKEEIGTALTNIQKEIEIIGSPKTGGQAATAAMKLEEWLQSGGSDMNSTAVVLADEEALFPLLYTLPQAVEKLNVTMGYSLRFSFTRHLAQSWLDLLEHAHGDNEKIQFYVRDVLRLLTHPFCKLALGPLAEKVSTTLKEEHILFPDRAFFASFNDEYLVRLFEFPADKDLIPHLRQILIDSATTLEAKSSSSMQQEHAFLMQYLKMLQRLHDQMDAHGITLSAPALLRILEQLGSSETIPFSGEPLEGLQVMGLLETRALDFERLIILGANEGTLPATSRHHSYIPYDLRKAFGMNTFDRQESLYAYHFYRLLQRSRRLLLSYDTHIGKLNEGEPSRYLRQIESELAPFHDIRHRKAEVMPHFAGQGGIAVYKSPELMKKLEEYLEGGLRYFSPSSFSTLLSCPLRFYFEKILGIREERKDEEELDAARLGDIFHHSMQRLYTPFLGKEMREEFYEQMEKELDNTLLQYYRKFYHSRMQKPMGRNLLNYQYLRQSALRIFEIERNLLNDGNKLIIEALECEDWSFTLPVKANGKVLKASISGKIDRVDRLNGALRIIDYKSGSQIQLKKTALENPDVAFDKAENKATLQGIIYALIYLKNHPGEKVKVAFYHLKKLSDGPNYLFDSSLSVDDLKTFEEGLSSRLAVLFDDSVPFRLTENVKECRYCAFRNSCDRS